MKGWNWKPALGDQITDNQVLHAACWTGGPRIKAPVSNYDQRAFPHGSAARQFEVDRKATINSQSNKSSASPSVKLWLAKNQLAKLTEILNTFIFSYDQLFVPAWWNKFAAFGRFVFVVVVDFSSSSFSLCLLASALWSTEFCISRQGWIICNYMVTKLWCPLQYLLKENGDKANNTTGS